MHEAACICQESRGIIWTWEEEKGEGEGEGEETGEKGGGVVQVRALVPDAHAKLKAGIVGRLSMGLERRGVES